jgi:hypothetical protein
MQNTKDEWEKKKQEARTDWLEKKLAAEATRTKMNNAWVAWVALRKLWEGQNDEVRQALNVWGSFVWTEQTDE